jgi:hypothetical protein
VSLPVGKDIESICGKCGDVWHVVVAKMGEQIAKVQCKQCGAVHRYRPPQKEKAKQAARVRVPGAPKERAARVSTPAGPRVTPSGVIRAYKPRDTFVPGDTISHPTFGHGVVEVATLDGKIEVYFAGERRVLVHARGGASSAPIAAPLPSRRPATGEETDE